MEPISAIGLAATAFEILDCVGVTLGFLLKLSTKFKHANTKVQLLIGFLSSLRVSINEVNSIVEGLANRDRYQDVVESLATTLECTKFAMSLLDSKLDSLRCDSSDMKAKLDKLLVILKGDEFGEWSSDIGHLVDALNLSLNALQSRSLLEQQGILSSPEAQVIMRTVEDRTSSMIWIEARKSETSRRDRLSETSANLDLAFSFDAQLMSSKVYQVAQRSHLRQALAAAKQQEARTTGQPPVLPTAQIDHQAMLHTAAVARRQGNLSAETVPTLDTASTTDTEQYRDMDFEMCADFTFSKAGLNSKALGNMTSSDNTKRIYTDHENAQASISPFLGEHPAPNFPQDIIRGRYEDDEFVDAYIWNSDIANGKFKASRPLIQEGIRSYRVTTENRSTQPQRSSPRAHIRRSNSLSMERALDTYKTSNLVSKHAKSSSLGSNRLLPPHEASEQVIKASKVGYVTPFDTTYKVLSLALQEYRISGDWREYALALNHNNDERRLRLDERPLLIQKQLDATGRSSVFKIQRLAEPPGAESTLPRLPVFTFDLRKPSFPVLVKILTPIASSTS